MNKIDSGQDPNSQDLLDHLHIIHNRHAGFTENIATNCCDLDGKNSYQLLLDKFMVTFLDLACKWGSFRVL